LQLFSALFRSWSHNLVAVLCLCFLAQEYTLASQITTLVLPAVELNVGDLVQLGKLADFLESPSLLHVRMELLYCGNGRVSHSNDSHPNSTLPAATAELTKSPQAQCCLPAVHRALYGLSQALASHVSALGSFLPSKKGQAVASATPVNLMKQPQGNQASGAKGNHVHHQQQQRKRDKLKVQRRPCCYFCKMYLVNYNH
jgi:hypothetical protein